MFFIQVDHLVRAAQADAGRTQFAAYYRFSIFVNAFVLLFGLFCFRLGGGNRAQSLKLGCAGILILLSGLNDLTMWAMYDWPGGTRPVTFDWASHVSVVVGHVPTLPDMLAFVGVHLALALAIVCLPLEHLVHPHERAPRQEVRVPKAALAKDRP
jgi:hypothetical protein